MAAFLLSPRELLLKAEEGDLISGAESHRRTPGACTGSDVHHGIAGCVKSLCKRVSQTHNEMKRENLACMSVSGKYEAYPVVLWVYRSVAQQYCGPVLRDVHRIQDR